MAAERLGCRSGQVGDAFVNVSELRPVAFNKSGELTVRAGFGEHLDVDLLWKINKPTLRYCKHDI